MTLGQAIDTIDRVQPNQIENVDKVRWLSELDGRVYHEILRTHRGFEWVRYTPFDPNVPPQHPLLIMHPYDALYLDYLEMKIADLNRETYQYNNALNKFNVKLQEYIDFINRNFPPKGARKLRLW